jgi:hypothetical protein
VICPFCKKTIHVEFYAGRWVAMRDGHEHACIGLVAALATADAPEKSARARSVPQRKQDRDLGVADRSDVSSPSPRKAQKSRRPVQLELQALD